MTNREAFRKALHLLNRRDRTRLSLVVVAQFLISLLDLVGVLLIGLVSAMAVSAASGLPLPPSLTNVIDRVSLGTEDPLQLAVIFAAVAAVVLVAKTFISALLSRRTLRFLAQRQAIASGVLTESLMHTSLLQVQARSTQAHAYALTSGVNAAISGIVGSVVIIATELSLLLVLGLGMLAVDPLVTICAALYFSALAIVVQRVLGAWASKMGRITADTSIDSQRFVQDALTTYREIAVLNRRQPVLDRFVATRRLAARSLSDTMFIGQIPKYAFEMGLVVGAIALTAVQIALKSPVEAVAILAVFLAAATRVTPSILRLQGAALTMRVSKGQAEPTFDLIDELEAEAYVHPSLSGTWEEPKPTNIDYAGFVPTIRLDGVDVQYPGQPVLALNHVTLLVEAGASLAIVGSSGAGKSTLADVVLGVITPIAGRIDIGGYEPRQAIARWPGAIAYVPQEVFVVEGTIRQNVALGLPDALINDDMVWEALRRSHLDTFAVEERQGLDTLVGDRGTQLSGGQRQRLGIARALYSAPKLIVLDEATSALDSETEAIIAGTISSLKGDVTTVIVAHRLATVRHADQVVYLQHGRIDAMGTFDEVRAQSDRFARQAELLGL